MSQLDPTRKPDHEGVHVKAKQKQELKFIGQARRPHAGMKLFGLNMDKREIFEVKIETLDTIDLSKKSKATSRAYINPKHYHVWAINKKNATRKLLRIKFKV